MCSSRFSALLKGVKHVLVYNHLQSKTHCIYMRCGSLRTHTPTRRCQIFQYIKTNAIVTGRSTLGVQSLSQRRRQIAVTSRLIGQTATEFHIWRVWTLCTLLSAAQIRAQQNISAVPTECYLLFVIYILLSAACATNQTIITRHLL